MKGLRFSDNETLDVRLAPLLPELDKLWWYWSVQTGPFISNWWDDNEALIDNYQFDIRNCQLNNCFVWRPGCFSLFAPHFNLDEWSYFVGFAAEEAQVESIACELSNLRFLECEFFRRTSLYTVFMVDVTANWFEFYSHNPQWTETLARHHAHVREVDSSHWIEYQRESARQLEELHRRKPTN